jgi:release factor glutamine methyltransferase
VEVVGPPRGGRYLPAEDTYLLRDALLGCSGGACLEIGFGTGAVVSSLARRFETAAATDVMPLDEARLSRAPGVDLVLADRAACFREASFDLVFFNPPYVPSDGVSDTAVDGGEGGVEVPARFLEEALRVLAPGGQVMVLLSGEGDLGAFEARCRSAGLEVERAAERRLFYETLVVYRLRRQA